MSSVRSCAVAGMFYPANPAELRAQIDAFLNAVSEFESDIRSDTQSDIQLPAPKALIAPHAGYIYSGPVAASVYARLRTVRDTIRHVVLLGPAHRVGFQGFAASRAAAFATPLGRIPLNQAALAEIAAVPGFTFMDRAHAQEHSLEVQLPFLQTVLADFSLTPLVVGDAEPKQVGKLLQTLWGGAETLIVISSDLSHYHDYDTACRRDRETSQAIIELRYEDIGYGDACGRNPIGGLLWLAQQIGLKGEIVDLRNSGDTAGPRDQVVGYGAYVFRE